MKSRTSLFIRQAIHALRLNRAAMAITTLKFFNPSCASADSSTTWSKTSKAFYFPLRKKITFF